MAKALTSRRLRPNIETALVNEMLWQQFMFRQNAAMRQHLPTAGPPIQVEEIEEERAPTPPPATPTPQPVPQPTPEPLPQPAPEQPQAERGAGQCGRKENYAIMAEVGYRGGPCWWRRRGPAGLRLFHIRTNTDCIAG
jgi:hypothetical protein